MKRHSFTREKDGAAEIRASKSMSRSRKKVESRGPRVRPAVGKGREKEIEGPRSGSRGKCAPGPKGEVHEG